MCEDIFYKQYCSNTKIQFKWISWLPQINFKILYYTSLKNWLDTKIVCLYELKSRLNWAARTENKTGAMQTLHRHTFWLFNLKRRTQQNFLKHYFSIANSSFLCAIVANKCQILLNAYEKKKLLNITIACLHVPKTRHNYACTDRKQD